MRRVCDCATAPRSARLSPKPGRGPYQFRKIQVCPKDLPAALRQAEPAVDRAQGAVGCWWSLLGGRKTHVPHEAARVHHAARSCGAGDSDEAPTDQRRTCRLVRYPPIHNEMKEGPGGEAGAFKETSQSRDQAALDARILSQGTNQARRGSRKRPDPTGRDLIQSGLRADPIRTRQASRGNRRQGHRQDLG
jgi:hypothetical protein